MRQHPSESRPEDLPLWLHAGDLTRSRSRGPRRGGTCLGMELRKQDPVPTAQEPEPRRVGDRRARGRVPVRERPPAKDCFPQPHPPPACPVAYSACSASSLLAFPLRPLLIPVNTQIAGRSLFSEAELHFFFFWQRPAFYF